MRTEYGVPVSDETKLRMKLRSIHPDEFIAALGELEVCLKNHHRKTRYYGVKDLGYVTQIQDQLTDYWLDHLELYASADIAAKLFYGFNSAALYQEGIVITKLRLGCTILVEIKTRGEL